MKQMQHDMTLIREYLNIHSTGRLNPNIIDPIHLRWELIIINKQLPTPNYPYLKTLEQTFGIIINFPL